MVILEAHRPILNINIKYIFYKTNPRRKTELIFLLKKDFIYSYVRLYIYGSYCSKLETILMADIYSYGLIYTHIR